MVPNFEYRRENPHVPKVIDSMKNWGNLEVAEIEEKFADNFVVLKTKQSILEAIKSIAPESKNLNDNEVPFFTDFVYDETFEEI